MSVDVKAVKKAVWLASKKAATRVKMKADEWADEMAVSMVES